MINFLSGLPRSGSTLLASLLSQHPKLHVTATNDLLELVVQVRNSWVGFDGFKSQGLDNVKPRIKTALRGMIRGFYAKEINEDKFILDKNRGWPAYIELLEDVLERPVRIVCPIRDIKEILASFEKLRRKHSLTAPHGQGDSYFQQQCIKGRCQELLNGNGVVGLNIRRILDALDRGYGDRLMFVPYQHFISDPQITCMQIFAFLGLKPIEVDVNNIEGPDHSRDIDIWGLPLHKIRNQIEHLESDWQNVLPMDIGQWIDSEFARMQMLAKF